MLKAGQERDLYPGERKDIVASALALALNNSMENSRRAHILDDLLDANPVNGEADNISENIKNLLKSYTSMNAAIKAKLINLGFEIKEDGPHYKLTFLNDPRYMFTLAKTPGDHRAGKNMASDICRKLF